MWVCRNCELQGTMNVFYSWNTVAYTLVKQKIKTKKYNAAFKDSWCQFQLLDLEVSRERMRKERESQGKKIGEMKDL